MSEYNLKTGDLLLFASLEEETGFLKYFSDLIKFGSHFLINCILAKNFTTHYNT